MTRDQYTKVGVAAHDAWEEDAKTNPIHVNPHAYVYGFKQGAQAILDDPSEWDLIKWEDYLKYNRHFQSQLSRYREALEEISNAETGGYEFEGLVDIAKEALKQ